MFLLGVDVYTKCEVGGGGGEKGYVLYTQLNVDNYGQPLSCLKLLLMCGLTMK